MTLLLLLAATLTPQQRAREAAKPFLPQMLELRRAAGDIRDPSLRAAAEAQLLAPPKLKWPIDLGPGEFASAPGGPCETGHHGYPGGLAVHTLANMLHARALADVYEHVYGVKLRRDWLTLAAIWHDSMKPYTLPWTAEGSCGPEPMLEGTPAHHVLGVAAAIARHLPRELVFVIASAHLAPTPGDNYAKVCGWVKAAAKIADEPTSCPPKADLEAFVTNSSDSDFALTGTAWTDYVQRAPKGWDRFNALEQDGNELKLMERSASRP